MIKSKLYAAVLISALAAPALAQTAAPPASADQFVSKAAPGEWRASKLSGVNIYGPNKESIGKVSDVVMDKSGAAKVVVISVGGVLGVGSKNVAVPFEAVQWSADPIAPPVTSSAPTGTGGTATAPMAPSASSSAASSVPAVYDYPDHGSVSMTIDQLKAAPDFHYASEKSS